MIGAARDDGVPGLGAADAGAGGAGVTAIVLTLNEERHLPECLASLAWADEVLVLDSGSQDETRAIASKCGATVVEHSFENFSRQRTVALGLAATDWVLFVDADERVPAALADEIRHVLQAPAAVAYWIPRVNLFWGHRMRGGGWWPDHQLRLLHVHRVRYDPERAVHEVADVAGATGWLSEPLLHHNYESPLEMYRKQRRYAVLDARHRLADGWTLRPRQLLTMPARSFWRRYVTLSGWRDGPTGLLACGLMAWYEVLVLRHLAHDTLPAGIDEAP